MNELIDSYHQQGSIPVFNRSTHEQILRDYIPGYEDDGFAALLRFADLHGYKVAQIDYKFRFEFHPADEPNDCREWERIDVPVEHH